MFFRTDSQDEFSPTGHKATGKWGCHKLDKPAIAYQYKFNDSDPEEPVSLEEYRQSQQGDSTPGVRMVVGAFKVFKKMPTPEEMEQIKAEA